MNKIKIWLLIVILLTGFNESLGQNNKAQAAVKSLDEPIQLRYRGVHFGDHRPWAYESISTMRSIKRDGKNLWIFESQQISEDPVLKSVSKIEFDPVARRTLLETSNSIPAGSFDYKFSMTDKFLVLGSVTRGGKTETYEKQLEAPVIGSFSALEPYLASLDLKEGYEETVTVMDPIFTASPVVRPLKLRVTKKQPFQLNGKSIPAYRVEVEPQDGNRRLTSVLLVKEEAPHVLLRSEYVVFPESLPPNQRKSTGFDVLVEIKPL